MSGLQEHAARMDLRSKCRAIASVLRLFVGRGSAVALLRVRLYLFHTIYPREPPPLLRPDKNGKHPTFRSLLIDGGMTACAAPLVSAF